MKSRIVWVLGIVLAFWAGMLFVGKDISNLFPIVLLLLCPLMMVFMMKKHH